jgi:hypothetical protein
MNGVGCCINDDGASGLRRWRELRCNDANLKITPTNQSLILARDPVRSGGAGSSSLLRQASEWAAGGAALKRVTILTARPDATVVVQADYFSDEEARSVDAQLPAVEQTSQAMTIVGKNPTTLSGPVATASYRNPIQLYTSVQRGLGDTKPALLDVLA